MKLTYALPLILLVLLALVLWWWFSSRSGGGAHAASGGANDRDGRGDDALAARAEDVRLGETDLWADPASGAPAAAPFVADSAVPAVPVVGEMPPMPAEPAEPLASPTESLSAPPAPPPPAPPAPAAPSPYAGPLPSSEELAREFEDSEEEYVEAEHRAGGRR